MTEIASASQIRGVVLRWALVLVPGILLLGFLSGKVAGSGPGNPWFDMLEKPAIYPAPELFGLVWSILYALMGGALAMIVSARGSRGRGLAIAIFVVQLLLNLAWSPVFFVAHQMTAALVLIGVLDVAVLVAIVLFARIRPVAALLLVPYLGWILFATVLTWQFIALNPAAEGTEASPSAVRVEF